MAQNLPEMLRYNWKVDSDLPEGTIELRDESGRVLGRIENIGKAPAPVEPRFAIALRIKELEIESARLKDAKTLRTLDEWHEGFGTVLWWRLPVEEPPYVGDPMCDDWPGYHTHWTPIIVPNHERSR